MSCLNRNGLNDFQFALLILSVSQGQRFFWSINKDIYLGRVYKMTDRQCHCILCLSTLLFSELSVNKQAKKACCSKQWNTVGSIAPGVDQWMFERNNIVSTKINDGIECDVSTQLQQKMISDVDE
ncbi:hypothetical protein PHYBLDRAFT_73470 [Phycomyces blakesleeanus NRRL 1555(-)]|uniref:Uncharacterized protein n=1 Tax=Phycomyces blakesleeanus (strain ATCC 8743b / DSM 1359 / FGSC 10004 / NBRC 33097 / NRRL 1555) TaxID=763407 RepID=A0A167RGG3_PHYB8|nr:hypothetical protein PHYBLDRAFT_73470 [Phycomyces blakesleeanus NRRL 1555(-)]OAD81572.1 hypothetical protein PHYBLDRAFT_73470 [Phycomyces blakesleeanus NRRL 1555(-)]|eukprot:XP_018299612.1 hypothetical protein PHYBLDRAFT_73470 [Phycomyces blakesleeanus NRRL 1555(-)]